MAIDWSNVQEKAGGNYKNYFSDGDYTAKCDGVEIKEVGQNGSVIMRFHFEETNDGQFPTADHWLSFKNDNWRIWHNKCLMQVLGATEDAAKKAVEMAESKDGKENIMKGYEACYKKLLAKKPEVKIDVYTDENGYARAEFKDRSVAMPHDNAPQKENKGDDILSQGEEIELADLPF
jgi:hypothetical protein